MIHTPRPEHDKLKKDLEADIKAYLQQGGKVEQVPQGASKQVDMTNGWKEGFSINDNVGFAKKKPYKPAKRVIP